MSAAARTKFRWNRAFAAGAVEINMRDEQRRFATAHRTSRNIATLNARRTLGIARYIFAALIVVEAMESDFAHA
jgi:hypothetical protein